MTTNFTSAGKIIVWQMPIKFTQVPTGEKFFNKVLTIKFWYVI